MRLLIWVWGRIDVTGASGARCTPGAHVRPITLKAKRGTRAARFQRPAVKPGNPIPTPPADTRLGAAGTRLLVAATGFRKVPSQIGQFPGRSWRTCGCIVQAQDSPAHAVPASLPEFRFSSRCRLRLIRPRMSINCPRALPRASFVCCVASPCSACSIDRSASSIELKALRQSCRQAFSSSRSTVPAGAVVGGAGLVAGACPNAR